MDTVTYPDPLVASYIEAHFLPVRLMLDNRQHWPVYRENHIIWTPTAGFMDRNGSLHYFSAGYLPPEEFIDVLRIGRARCLMAWTRWAEAEEALVHAAEPKRTFAPEALYWLGVSRYLEQRRTDGMWEAWDRLARIYPESPWARKIYPRSEGI